jgi:DNA-binding winged helix-turn-helix (wHTH) protein
MTDPNEESTHCVYLICNEIEFYPENHLLRSRYEQKELNLFSTASRCLEMLLINQGVTVPKRDIMKFAWTEHGLSVSENTFYQNISSLRKAIAELLPEKNVVVTVKRAGLLIPQSVKVMKIEMQTEKCGKVAADGNRDPVENSDHEVQEKPNNDVTEMSSLPVESEKKSISRKVIRWIQLCLGGILLALTGFHYVMTDNHQKKIPQGSPFENYVIFKRLGSHCTLYVNPDAGIIDTSNKYLNIDSAGCKGYERVYVTLFEGSAKSSAMYCTLKKNQGYSCVSEYFARSQK